MLSKKFDLYGKEQVCSYAQVYIKALKAIEVQERLDVGNVPEVIPPMKTFLPRILYQLSTYFGREEL